MTDDVKRDVATCGTPAALAAAEASEAEQAQDAIDLFGEVVPGEAVRSTARDPTAGYAPRGRFVRRVLDGRPMRVPEPAA